MGWHELLWIGKLLVLMQLVHGVVGWGKDGHYAVCKIAEGYLTKNARGTVRELLPDLAGGELASVCSWPDEIKWYYKWHWTSPLHYVDTPDFKCNYKHCLNLTEAVMLLAHYIGGVHQVCGLVLVPINLRVFLKMQCYKLAVILELDE
ncbi:Quinone oxidoreductase PIG3 [Hibiscus syriacus]|uniref:Aspergillus nuclease S1 n=1 Tax=Hibiscus syriacus TaxID=106335 RepID=A0A6A3BUV0_HIBSY|nr:Quinone oxidoreductase PIG3 [Hibiscus syriacus]